jgi:anion-transporting  ArsA/GET3 family ATPase
MEIYAFCGKGGVGKTTICCEFARYIQTLGKNVLVVGIDQQNNAAEYIRDQKYEIPNSGVNTYAKVSQIVDYVINETFLKNFRSYVPLIAPDFISICAVADQFHEIRGKYDVVCIDFPPNHAGLKILSMPNILNNLAFKAITIKQRVHKVIAGSDKTLAEINLLWDKVKAFKADMDQTKFIAIGTPTDLGYTECVKLCEYVVDLKYKIHRVMVNMIPGINLACDNCSARYEKAYFFTEKYIDYSTDKGYSIVVQAELIEPAEMISCMKSLV